MKYIKKYENIGLSLDDNSYYLMQNNLIEILQNIDGTERIQKKIVTKDCSKGAFLSKDHDNCLRFWSLKFNDSKREALNYYNKHKYTYRGELKIIDGKVIIDTLEIDTKKYNM
jgi:hypothetical protein